MLMSLESLWLYSSLWVGHNKPADPGAYSIGEIENIEAKDYITAN